MINPKDQAALDQAISGMREIMPSLWRSLYDGCVEKGFTESQALMLVCTYITTAYRSNNAPSA